MELHTFLRRFLGTGCVKKVKVKVENNVKKINNS